MLFADVGICASVCLSCMCVCLRVCAYLCVLAWSVCVTQCVRACWRILCVLWSRCCCIDNLNVFAFLSTHTHHTHTSAQVVNTSMSHLSPIPHRAPVPASTGAPFAFDGSTLCFDSSLYFFALILALQQHADAGQPAPEPKPAVNDAAEPDDFDYARVICIARDRAIFPL